MNIILELQFISLYVHVEALTVFGTEGTFDLDYYILQIEAGFSTYGNYTIYIQSIIL